MYMGGGFYTGCSVGCILVSWGRDRERRETLDLIEPYAVFLWLLMFGLVGMKMVFVFAKLS